MLQNAFLLAKIGADTAENEQHFAEILPTKGLMLICIAPSRVASADRAVWKSGCVCSVRARSRSKIPERSFFTGMVDP